MNEPIAFCTPKVKTLLGQPNAEGHDPRQQRDRPAVSLPLLRILP